MSEAKIIVSAEDRSKAVLAGVKASLGQVQSKGAELNEGFGKLGAVLGSAFAGLSFTAFVRATANGIDALNDIKDATGASIENISALEDIALRTGTQLDTVTVSLVKLNQTLNAAKPDSPQADALQAIGLSAEALKKEDPAEALRQTAVALSAFADDGNKARLVQELFGRSIREVAPLLNDLATQSKLVGTVTAAQADEAEKFNKQLAQFEKNSVDAARAVASALLPALNGLFEAYKKFGGVKGIGAAILGLDEQSQLETQAKIQTAAVKRAGDTVDILAEGVKRNPEDTQLLRMLTKARERLSALQTEAATTADSLKRLADESYGSSRNENYGNEGRNVPKPSVQLAAAAKPGDDMRLRAEKINHAQQALAQYVHTLQEQIDKTADLTEKEKALDLLKSLGANGEVSQVRELVLGMEQRLTLLRQDEAIRRDIAKNIDAEAKATQDLDDAIYKYSGRLEEARKIAETARLEAQLAAGVEYSPAELDNIVNGIAGIKTEVKTEVDEMDEMFKQFARNVQDSLGSTIKSTLKGDFDNIGQLWGNLLLDMIAQAAAAQVGKELFGDFFKGGPLGGGAGSLLKMGASFFGIPGFAAGGQHAGGLRIVGEKGPELELTGPARIFSASQTAQLLQAGAGGGGALNLTYAPVIQIDSRADRAQALQDTQAAVRQGQRELIGMLKAKGVY